MVCWVMNRRSSRCLYIYKSGRSLLGMTKSPGHLLLTEISPQCVHDLRRTGKSCLLINATGQQSRICGQGSEWSAVAVHLLCIFDA